MKSVKEVMETKTFIEYEDDKYSFSGYIHLVPIRESSIYNEVDSVISEISILDKWSKNSIYFPKINYREFRRAFGEFTGSAVINKCDEWADAVRHERKYDLFAAYQNAVADYANAVGE